ncbi:hypothetical protein [Actinomadura kijaniata]|uniref:hypothetical protein n=1 Tax=Actinomadura kijaniata TaxID=46161 RepID=UPI0031D51089
MKGTTMEPTSRKRKAEALREESRRRAAGRQRRRDDIIRATIDQEMAPRWASRAGRRRLVGLAAGLLALPWAAVVVCWHLAPSDTAMWATFGLCLAAALGFTLLASPLMKVTRGVAGAPDRLLDERQITERLRAQALAHRATLTLLLAAAVLVSTTVPDEGDVATLPSAVFAVFSIALLATVAALPMLIAAWRMPDPLPDDED